MDITLIPQVDWSKLQFKQAVEGDAIRVSVTVPVPSYRVAFPARDAQR